MPWAVAALPLILFLLAAWLVAGHALARRALGLRGGVEAALLSLPLGLLAQVLLTNALGYVSFLPRALGLTPLVALAAGGLALRSAAPLDWELGRRARLALLLLSAGVGLFVWHMGSREVFGDDGGHASMAHLLAAGEFPLRFQCDPSLRASYAYGGNLLAAQVMVVTGAPPFEALDLVRAATVTSVLGLAFLVGWKPRRSAGAGLLAAFLLLTVGPMVWIHLPLAHGDLAQSAGVVQHLLTDPWTYSVVVPGFITPTYGHAHRALAWGFAPFQALLFLALLQAPSGRRAKTVALGLVLGATPLMQPAILALLLPGFAAYVALASWRSRRLGSAGLDFHLPTVLALSLFLALFQGGPLTDSWRDRLEGVANPTTGFHFDPIILPSCRRFAPSVPCLLLSIANVGLAPLLLPWATWRLRRGLDTPRGLALLGAWASYAVPFFFRYDYIDWNIQRLITYTSWVLAVVLAPLLAERLRDAGPRRWLAGAAILVMSYQGLVTVGVVVDGSWVRDRADRAFFSIGPLDAQMARHAHALPRGALVLDPAPCMSGTACRAAILFGRYAASSLGRLQYQKPSARWTASLRDPRPETLRTHGYTHLYADRAWLQGLPPDVRAGLRGSAFAVVGAAVEADDLRLLLRVCRSEEGCALEVPGVIQ